MGLFCVNFHVQTTDDKAVAAALQRRNVTRYRLLPAKGGWSSLSEERASDQDDKWIRELAGRLSQDLDAAVIAFMVHDSDIACYWLYGNGQLLDEYNSCPDYFDDDATDDESPGSSGGQPGEFVRFCRSGVSQEDIEAILREDAVFAENIVERLAEKLGIDPSRALADFRHADDDDDGPDDMGGADDDDGDDDGDTAILSPKRTDLKNRLAQMLGVGAKSAPVDPKAQALVEAAANDDLEAIERLVADGAAIDAEAPMPHPGAQSLANMSYLLPQGAPKMSMTPLLAAIVYKRKQATARLLERGADPNRVHPLFGTAVHTATTSGEVELLQLVIDHGGDADARNAQSQTPLQALAVSRAAAERLTQAQAMLKSMGLKVPPTLAGQLAKVTLPTAGWEACERLLKERGGAR